MFVVRLPLYDRAGHASVVGGTPVGEDTLVVRTPAGQVEGTVEGDHLQPVCDIIQLEFRFSPFTTCV